ncbi:MAG: sensor histidine kinase [Cyanobacteria bacterium QH_8_48_120]|jgi:signal transduction histidine kinase|nr:MAG: sensor histidine kinase [Cyanobacteria bacterium QH_1_48_107]PSO55732.1 MAG: sensor histidine kinase [Cyanobacteria bacterium QH_10_48_56]PSO63561.1 MAG: sensor histidine kinase [Cyanobacteria bacterium QH_7_48_89]PSO64286.1 MAG: sensor histidine kinase [Cyanobacteria bacterium QH_2_48_84]PSO65862.1 MAG: sensor histidine kinase [Cyanobacteria bacterium QH_6_48_35]PSO68654.1 MAG: sensor histidine kinase [Cyanobacteria bacterium QH_8_48_120]PSO73505.1 MAG: sensor histidine kinase [Cyano
MSHFNRTFVPASSEFVTLSQSQLAWLKDWMGATRSVVYLAKEVVEGTRELILIAGYPETKAIGQESDRCSLAPEALGNLESAPRLLSQASLEEEQASPDQQAEGQQDSLQRQRHQIVMPLIHQNVVMGFLVTGRQEQEWNEQEFAQIQKIADTLAIACVLDQRQGWYKQQLNQQQRIQEQQRDRLDDLLHQLRNPLTALRTFSKLLLKRFQSDERNRTLAENLAREGDRLRELLQQFDDYIDLMEEETHLPAPNAPSVSPSQKNDATSSSLPPGESLSLESLEVKEVLEPLLPSTEAIAQDQGINFTANIPPDLLPIQGDRKALPEVFNNLLDNALKYTPAGGEIQLQAGVKQETSSRQFQGITIHNSGSGISPEDQERIFERHYRGAQESGETSGSGLGLAIAKELVEQMQGTIELTSSSDSGTSFTVWLPCQ